MGSQVLEQNQNAGQHSPELRRQFAYRMDEVEHLRQFDQFKLLMLEQPLWNDDIYYHARLQKQFKPDSASMNPSARSATQKWLSNSTLAASSTLRLDALAA